MALSKSVLLNQPAAHTNYVSIALYGEVVWGLDASGTSESMQVEEGSQDPKQATPLEVPERFLSQRCQGSC